MPSQVEFEVLQSDGSSPQREVLLSWTSSRVAGFGVTTPSGGPLPPWLQISSTGSSSPLTLTLTRIPQYPIAPGVQTATLRIIAGDANYDIVGHVDLTVTHDVVPLPTVGSLTVFETVESEIPAPQSLDQSHDSRITFTGVSSTATWLDESGTNPISVTPNAEVAELAPGAHCTNVVLNYQYVDQAFNVQRGICLDVGTALSGPESIALGVDASTVGPALTGLTGTIETATTAEQPLTISSSQPWLVIDDTSIATGSAGNLAMHVDAAQLAGLPNGTHTATITASAPGLTPLEIPFTLDLDLPFVHTVAPLAYAGLFTGESIIVRGEGFQQPGASLTFDGQPIEGAQVLNDTELRFTPATLAAGSYAVAAGNQLGLARPSATLRVVDAPFYGTYSAALPSEAVRVRVSPVNNSVYAAVCYFCGYSSPGSVIRRYSYDAGTQTWTSSTLGVPSLYDIALTLDESRLIVLTATQLRFHDPVTLALEKVVTLPTTFSSAAMQLAVTNDGKVHIQSLGKAYSLPLEAFVPTTVPFGFGITAPADGSLALTGEQTNSGSVPFRWYNASTGAVQATSTFQYFDPLGSLSRTGNRALIGNMVLDEDFTVEATIPTYSGVVNPAGTRAYSVDYASWTIRVFDLTTFPYAELAPLALGGDVGVTRLAMDPRGTALFALAEDKFFVFDLR